MESNIRSTSRIECIRESVATNTGSRLIHTMRLEPNMRYVFRAIYSVVLSQSEANGYDHNLSIRENSTGGPFLLMVRSGLGLTNKIEASFDGVVFFGGRTLYFYADSGATAGRAYLTLIYDEIDDRG